MMRGGLARRRWIPILLALCCLMGLPSTPARGAGSTVPYYNLRHAFAFAYPSTWIQLRVAGADYAVLSPDLNGVLSVTVGPGVATDPVLRKALRAAFIPFGRPTHPIQMGTYNLQGGVAQQAQAVLETPAHRQMALTVLAVSHHQRVYLIMLVVQDIRQASAAGDSAALEAALSTFALF